MINALSPWARHGERKCFELLGPRPDLDAALEIFSGGPPPRTPAPCFSLPPADPERFPRGGHDG